MKQFVLDHLNTEIAKIDGARITNPVNPDGDLYAQLKSGKQVVFYVINRALRLPEIREKYETNTARRLYSLFVVDQRLLPAHGDYAEAAYWVQALHALAQGRIYTYTCDRRVCTIKPLHIDWKWGAEMRHFEYGPAVSVAHLRTDILEVNSKCIVGVFAAASFGDAPFWQRRSPGEEDKGQKYSWRNFSFRSEKKRAEPPPRSNDYWDQWADFQNTYAENAGEESTFDWENIGRENKSGQNRRVKGVGLQDYALLGVNLGASFDEVKRAYRRKARENHPDMHPPHRRQEFTVKMAEINAAFEAIKKQLEGE
jgi:hypothetical protein